MPYRMMKWHNAEVWECGLFLHMNKSLYIIDQNDVWIQVKPGKVLRSFFSEDT